MGMSGFIDHENRMDAQLHNDIAQMARLAACSVDWIRGQQGFYWTFLTSATH